MTAHPKPERVEKPVLTWKELVAEKQAKLQAKANNMKARDVLAALRQRHCNDIFLTEVTCGRAEAQGWDRPFRGQPGRDVEPTRRMDAISITRRWSKVVVCGFEVKVDRQDFLRDQKWAEYLPWCNRFYFATPKDLLTPEEKVNLQEQGVGLIEARVWGDKIVARRVFAPDHRPFPGGRIPWQLYHTIILNKAHFKATGPLQAEV